MSSDIAIRVQGLTKSFRLYERPEHRLLELMSFGRVQRHRTFTALKDVSLEIRRGETVGIVGRNGCGKSTLLQVICGILQPTAGTVTTQGRIAALLELGAGFDGNFTGRENVYLNGALHGRTRAEMEERIEAIIAFADIGEFIDRPVKTYSSGMFVRLAFATAVNVDPDILVVDEALAVGDEAFQRKCFARIEQIKERGATILFVSHDAQTIIQLCDRAVLMDGGETLAEGAPKAVVAKYQRLANSKPERRGRIRDSILNGICDNASTVLAEQLEPNNSTNLPDQQFFDTALLTHRPPPQEVNGAFAHQIALLSPDGRIVNVLQTGGRYRVRGSIQLDEEVPAIDFTFMFRTLTGVLIGGATTPTLEVKAGQLQIDIEFDFVCRLLAGTYLMNFRVSSYDGGDETIVFRAVDALMFRVEPLLDSFANGMVDFDVRFSVAHENSLREG
jgi:lipopolysaccharide transport system ATP-binding protein